jgi:CheY-like chemotaxis protein
MSQVAISNEPSLRAAQAAEANARRILILDDNAADWASLRELLRLNGHRVEYATNLVAALAHSFHPEVVLLDIAMPQQAFAALRKLKDAFLGPKIFAVGGKSGRRAEVLSYGFDGYFTKPVRVNAIEAAIARSRPIGQN